jgi:hypothetical protein
VLVEMPAQRASSRALLVGEGLHAPPPRDRAFQLRGGRGLGQLEQVGLGVPVSDPGQRPPPASSGAFQVTPKSLRLIVAEPSKPMRELPYVSVAPPSKVSGRTIVIAAFVPKAVQS